MLLLTTPSKEPEVNNKQLRRLVDAEVRAVGFEPHWENGTRHKKCYVRDHLISVLSHGHGTTINTTVQNTLTATRRNLRSMKEASVEH